MEKYIKSILAMAVAALALTACSQDDSVPAGMESTPAIGYNVVVPDTRGTMITGSTFDKQCFGITAILHHTENQVADSVQTNFNNMYNIRASHETGTWLTDTQYLWPEDDLLSFYAYYPYASKDSAGIHLTGTGTNTDGNATGPLVVDYTVPTTLGEQTDLMTAVRKNQRFVVGGSANVTLNFTHALTAISFKIASMPEGTLKSIAFNGIQMQGKYNIADDTWDFTDYAPTNYSTTLNKSVIAERSQDVTDDSKGETFLLIPQDFTSKSQTISFVFNDGQRDYVLSKSLEGTSWPEGKHVVYTVTINSLYELSLQFELAKWEDARTTTIDGDAKVEE